MSKNNPWQQIAAAEYSALYVDDVLGGRRLTDAYRNRLIEEGERLERERLSRAANRGQPVPTKRANR